MCTLSFPRLSLVCFVWIFTTGGDWILFGSGAGPGGQRLCAGDWPQILGPHRTGVADDEDLANAWDEGGPPLVWHRQVGSGYAGPAVANGQLILFHRERNEEVVERLDALTGEPVWRKSYPTAFRPQVGGEDGPLVVPMIVGDRVLTFGAEGVLTCWSLDTGEMIWRRRTHEEFGAQQGYFGAGSSPLLDQNRVIVNVGGFRSGAGVVAFDLRLGDELWRATDDQASYSSPLAVTIDGTRHLLVVTRSNCVSLDPETGTVRFSFPFGQRGPTVNGASPVVIDDHLFLTASYGIGAVYGVLGSESFLTLWQSDEHLSSQYTTPIAIDGKFYGVHGRQDTGEPSPLVCLDPVNSRVLWEDARFGYATLIHADGKLLVLGTNGFLWLTEVSPEGLQVISQAHVSTGTTRPLPALSNGLIYLRDESTLMCYDLRP